MANLKPATVRFDDAERKTRAYHRTRTEETYIERQSRYLYRVRVGDEDNHRAVLLARDHGKWRGGCSCPWWFFCDHRRGSPCVHLWAVKRAVEDSDEFTIHHTDAALEPTSSCPRCGQERPDPSPTVEEFTAGQPWEVIRGP